MPKEDVLALRPHRVEWSRRESDPEVEHADTERQDVVEIERLATEEERRRNGASDGEEERCSRLRVIPASQRQPRPRNPLLGSKLETK